MCSIASSMTVPVSWGPQTTSSMSCRRVSTPQPVLGPPAHILGEVRRHSVTDHMDCGILGAAMVNRLLLPESCRESSPTAGQGSTNSSLIRGDLPPATVTQPSVLQTLVQDYGLVAIASPKAKAPKAPGWSRQSSKLCRHWANCSRLASPNWTAASMTRGE